MTSHTCELGTFSVDLLKPLVRALEDAGGDVRRVAAQQGLGVLTEAGFSIEQLSDPELRLPHSLAIRLLDQAVQDSGDPAFALRAGATTLPDDFGLYQYVTSTAPDLRESIRVAQRYLPLLHDGGEIDFEQAGDLFIWRHRHAGAGPEAIHLNEYVIASFAASARRMLGIDVPPEEIRFAHAAPAYHDVYASVLRTPVRFNEAWNTIVLRAEGLDLPMVDARPALHAVLLQYAEERMRRIGDKHPFTSRVRALVLEHVADASSLEHIADVLHMSARTVRRRLAAEGGRYVDIVDGVRRERALELLGQSDMTVSEIGYALGFAHPPAFQRACKRWFGQTPRTVRDQRRDGPVYRFYRGELGA